jgi:nucleoid-associated protein YgaU
MIAMSTSRMIALFAAVVAVAGTAIFFALPYLSRQPSGDAKIALPAPVREQAPAALAAVQAQANAVVTALAGLPAKPDADDGTPSFDIARIEPTGEAVIAGRATPGATVELLRNGEVHDRIVADRAGEFAMVPPKLPPGTYDLTLRATQPDGKKIESKQRVAVAFEKSPNDRPVVALMTPNKPTVVLSQGSAAKPAPGTVAVEAVEIEPGGKFHVSGRARPGAAMRFYLNDSFVAPVTAGADGRFAVTINEGVAPGSYRVRVDEVEQNSGTVRARAEVPFSVPDTLVTGTVAAQAAASKRPELAAAQPPASAAANVSADKGSPSAVVVPRIVTATVSRGDSLWSISNLTYGAGTRYAVIYKANQEQIRNPNLIYPGQIFVLPTQ